MEWVFLRAVRYLLEKYFLSRESCCYSSLPPLPAALQVRHCSGYCFQKFAQLFLQESRQRQQWMQRPRRCRLLLWQLFELR